MEDVSTNGYRVLKHPRFYVRDAKAPTGIDPVSDNKGKKPFRRSVAMSEIELYFGLALMLIGGGGMVVLAWRDDG